MKSTMNFEIQRGVMSPFAPRKDVLSRSERRHSGAKLVSRLSLCGARNSPANIRRRAAKKALRRQQGRDINPTSNQRLFHVCGTAATGDATTTSKQPSGGTNNGRRAHYCYY